MRRPRALLLASLLAPFARGDEQERLLKGADYFKVVTSRTCVGEQTEYGTCEHKPICPALCTSETTVDCTFDSWSEWADPGGCAGVCSRQRAYKTQNNACGKPCQGTKMETKTCKVDATCLRPVQDCKLSAWQPWTSCGTSKLDQITRIREIAEYSKNGGKTCQGPLRETKPCGSPTPPESCEMSKWTPWSNCSSSCGFGLRKRERKIAKPSKYEGDPCNATTSEQMVCSAGACKEKKDCTVSEWGDWGTCNELYQQVRTKTVTQAVAGGTPCGAMNVKEMKACDFTPPENCKFNDWTKWEACDKSCDGGQKLRTRTLKTPPKYGGNCAGHLSETAPCGNSRCKSPDEHDCHLLDWNDWSPCSVECGVGVKTRSVKGLKKMENKGRSCKNITSEMVTCKIADCIPQPCKWSEWGKWEPCSVTCGGGFVRRHREIAISPRFGGAACEPRDKSQVEPCEMKSCLPACKDGQWDDWSEWNTCSAKCGSGYKLRTRGPSLNHTANYCGWPPTGSKQEFDTCDTGKPCAVDQDCKLSDWSAWGPCSATCFGLRQRSRTVSQYAVANGKGCQDEALKEMEPCNPGAGEKYTASCGSMLPMKNCQLSNWSAWQPCTAKCNGGQKLRSRNILSPPQNNGKACESRLQETTECGMEPCGGSTCVDCEISAWSSWGACTHSGQSERTREVKTFPDWCGKKCASKVISEVKHCSLPVPESRYCAWGDWSAYSSCPSTCSESRRKRTRALSMMMKASAEGYFLKVSGSSQNACFGSQVSSEPCDMSKCKPLCKAVDCKLGDWEDWSVPMGYGLCRRGRSILTSNNECGKPCIHAAADMEETKACPVSHITVDCGLSVWSEWSHCESPESLRYRMRHVEGDPRNGGKACADALKEAQSCYITLKPVDCSFTDWSDWNKCDTLDSPFKANNETCGTGHQERTRRIGRISKAGGAACTGSLEEVRQCSGESCKTNQTTDCKWDEWEDWSNCKVSLQRYRTRAFKPSKNNGAACHGEAEQIRGCALEKVNCALTQWADWSNCSSDCHGMRFRTRDLETRHKDFGKVCALSPLNESSGCNTMVKCPSEEACKYTEWAAWGNCSVTCGFAGQEVRSRDIKSNRKADGDGCLGAITQTRACADLRPCHQEDCKWNDWGDWTQCSKDCGAGQKTRTRNLKAATMGEGAKPCPVSDTRQTEPCNEDKCKALKCVDGTWDEWSSWEACSATCGAGVTWRRRVTKREANYCGKPVTGPSQQIASCSSEAQCPGDVDCKFGDWQDWTTCSATCDGTKRRSRTITTRAVGNGKACKASMEETAPCKPAERQKGCLVSGTPIDCVLTHWSSWSACAETCGASQRERSRKVSFDARNGGKDCHPVMTETDSCKLSPCPTSQGMIVMDCQWEDWSPWSACTQCGGIMYRGRQVKHHAQYGGKNCTGEKSQDLKTCEKSCDAHHVHCAWSSWKDWSDCDISCVPHELRGHPYGRRTRKRHLEVVKNNMHAKLYEEDASNEDVDGHLQELYRRAQNVDSRRWQEVSAAFAFGCLSFLLGFGVLFRGSTRVSASDRAETSQQQRNLVASGAGREEEDAERFDGIDPSYRPMGQIFERDHDGRRQALI